MDSGWVSVMRPLDAVDDLAVIERSPDRIRVQVAKWVRASDPYMEGHFPDRTIYPGVFIIETVRQATRRVLDPALPVDLTALGARFHQPAFEGDRLDCLLTIDRVDAGWSVVARCSVGGTKAAKVTMQLSAAPTPSALHHDVVHSGTPLSLDAVLEGLPHGHPMVLIDGAMATEDPAALVGVKAVTWTEPCFRTAMRDPNQRGTYPASLLLESLAQTAALAWSRTREHEGGQLLFGAVRGFRVHGAVTPGETMWHRVRLDRVFDGAATASGWTSVGDRVIASVESLTAVVRPAHLVGSQGHR